MPEPKTIIDAVIACLLHGAPDNLRADRERIKQQVQRVLDNDAPDHLEQRPRREQLQQYLDEIRAVLPASADRIALVAGGATKIKGYVFEAPKLPEIRGASALLDWVNETALKELWRNILGSELGSEELAEKCIIYSGGGGFLAFAPAELGQKMATAIERCYTEHTLTANSVAVSKTFHILELRYGRLSLKDDRISYWVDDFLEHWQNPKLREQLAFYYAEGKEPEDRFYRRKTFGELVTQLSTMTNRRRDERASYGEPRSTPLYEVLPWAELCDSSGSRPAIMRTQVGNELQPRELSEASARKRYVGQLVKVRQEDQQKATEWFFKHFGDEWTKRLTALSASAWEQRWVDYLKSDGQATRYAQRYAELLSDNQRVWPAQDTGEIGQASLPRRYIGMIYADGNNVGRLIATLKTPAEYAEVSSALYDATQLAVFEALSEHLIPHFIRTDQGELRWAHPFEILAIGGDDIFLLVPGDRAFDIAATIAHSFERRLSESLSKHALPNALSSATVRGRYAADTNFTSQSYTPSLGLSAGVLVAQESAPIFFLRELVEELLKGAKGKAKENAKQGFYSGAIDFMVMKSISMVTDKIGKFRKMALGDIGKDTPANVSVRRLLAKPYSWHEFAGLLQTIRALKRASVPRSQLYRLRRALDMDSGTTVVSSVMEYLYTRSRFQDKVSAVLAEHIEGNWCRASLASGGRGGLPPWMPLGEHQNRWETFWPDMLEAYEMVPQLEEA